MTSRRDIEFPAEDGIHPNAAGYTALAELWMAGVTPLLGA
jgi:lysophospholipase L1-like esterase